MSAINPLKMIEKEKLKALEDRFSWLIIFVKYKRLILGVVLSVTVVTVLVTKLLVKPKFQSSAIVYAVPSYGPESVIPPQHFGSDEDNEAFIQILESNEVEKVIEKKYNLMQHYDIDVRSKKKNEYLINKYRKNVEIDKTTHGSIRISVSDVDPVIAANMANDIVEIAGSVLESIKKANVIDVLKDREREYFTKKDEIDSLETALAQIRELIDPSNPYDFNSIKFVRLKKQFLGEIGNLADKKGKYELAYNHYTAKIPAYYSIDSAIPNYEKVFPKTIMILIVVLAPVLTLLLLLITFFEKL